MKRLRNITAGLLVFLLCVSGANATMLNGGFEQFDGTIKKWDDLPAAGVMGWDTTASDNRIEIWKSGFNGVAAYEGGYFAELNANMVSTLYQDVSGIARDEVVGFEFAHRGRLGEDTMRLTITDFGQDGEFDTGDDTVLFSELYTDGNDEWGVYTGLGVTGLGNTMRFAFESVFSAGNKKSYGNFLDAVSFGGEGAPIPNPEPSTIFLLGCGLLLAAGLGRRRMRQ